MANCLIAAGDSRVWSRACPERLSKAKITLAKPTKEMLAEAASAGFYTSAWGKHPKLQIMTVEELLNGKEFDRPPTRQADVTLKKRARSATKVPEQLKLPRYLNR